jgi:hypothetical protein
MNADTLLVFQIIGQEAIHVQGELVLRGVIKNITLCWMVTDTYMYPWLMPPTVKSGNPKKMGQPLFFVRR